MNHPRALLAGLSLACLVGAVGWASCGDSARPPSHESDPTAAGFSAKEFTP